MRRAAANILPALLARLTRIGRPLRRAVVACALLLTLGIALGACTSYDNIKHSVDPNPIATGTPPAYANPTPIALLQRDGSPYDTTVLCQGGNWPMDWTKEGIALVAQTLVAAVYMSSYALFRFVLYSDANSPVDVAPVLTAFNIVDYICLPILTLAIVWNGFKIASSGLTGFDYQRSVRSVGKAVLGIILLTPTSIGGGPAEPLLAWAASLPPLVADTLFHTLIQQPTDTLYQLGGLLTSDKCYFYAAPMVYVGCLVIGALMLLLSIALFVKSVVIFLYFVATPVLVALWPFDEFAVFQTQIVTGYTVATVSAIPLGIALLIAGQFVLGTIGNDALTDIVYMLYVAAFMYIGFKVLTTMLGGGVARAMGAVRTAAGVATAPVRYVAGRAQTAAGIAVGVAAGPGAGMAVGALGQGRFSHGARAGAYIARERRNEERNQQSRDAQSTRNAQRQAKQEIEPEGNPLTAPGGPSPQQTEQRGDPITGSTGNEVQDLQAANNPPPAPQHEAPSLSRQDDGPLPVPHYGHSHTGRFASQHPGDDVPSAAEREYGDVQVATAYISAASISLPAPSATAAAEPGPTEAASAGAAPVTVRLDLNSPPAVPGTSAATYIPTPQPRDDAYTAAGYAQPDNELPFWLQGADAASTAPATWPSYQPSAAPSPAPPFMTPPEPPAWDFPSYLYPDGLTPAAPFAPPEPPEPNAMPSTLNWTAVMEAEWRSSAPTGLPAPSYPQGATAATPLPPPPARWFPPPPPIFDIPPARVDTTTYNQQTVINQAPITPPVSEVQAGQDRLNAAASDLSAAAQAVASEQLNPGSTPPPPPRSVLDESSQE